MNTNLLLAQYSLVGILGLDNLHPEEKEKINNQATEAALKNALIKLRQEKQISEEQFNRMLQTESEEIQETLIHHIPNFKEIYSDEIIKIKKAALLTQIQDLMNFSKTKVMNQELIEKIEVVCNNMTTLLNREDIKEEDQRIFDIYYKLRNSLDFNK